jgi:membrane-bound serine protease (ClpP class)
MDAAEVLLQRAINGQFSTLPAPLCPDPAKLVLALDTIPNRQEFVSGCCEMSRVKLQSESYSHPERHWFDGGFLRAVLQLALLLTPFWSQATAEPARGAVVLVEVQGAIGVASSEHIAQGVDKAEQDNAQLILIRLDTPGGLVSSTRDIIKTILASRIPVAVYVAPSGAHAASAGTYITLAAHIAAMAPGTSIGAATPIQISMPSLPVGQDPRRDPSDRNPKLSPGPTTLEKKTVNDAVALIRSLAQLRGRNADWAEKSVRDAVTLTTDEALREGVIEVVARDVDDLLSQIDGRMIAVPSGEVHLSTRGEAPEVFAPTLRTKVLSVLADPNVAFILLLIGIYGILFELWSPGLAGSGIVGAICLLLALTAFTAMPVNYAALSLLLFGIALMTAEAFVPGVGILGLGGVVSFVIGALFLFDPEGGDFDLRVAWPLVAGTAMACALLSIGALGLAMTARQRAVVTGAEQMIGSEATVIEWNNGCGRVRTHGEVWFAEGPADLTIGATVRVDRLDGLTLIVVAASKGVLT